MPRSMIVSSSAPTTNIASCLSVRNVSYKQLCTNYLFRQYPKIIRCVKLHQVTGQYLRLTESSPSVVQSRDNRSVRTPSVCHRRRDVTQSDHDVATPHRI